jgi:general nucleoside transport system ATP-binding protein
MGSAPLLKLIDMTVRFPGVLACDQVNLEIHPGEVHAVVGENGAGKSTLMHSLMGLVRPASGRLEVCGFSVPMGSPKASRRAGISMVFQRFRLVPTLTVAQNVILGLEGEPYIYSHSKLNKKIQAEIDRFELDLDPGAMVRELSAGAMQQVEILRVLYLGAKVLILDEPTSVLTPLEVERLLKWIRRRASEGVGVFLITHKVREVLDVSDRITVLRQGKIVANDICPKTCTEAQLSSLMVGDGEWKPTATAQAIESQTQFDDKSREPILSFDHVSALSGLGRERLEQVSFELYPGEVLGVAGVSGNGQGLLAHVAAGLVRPKSGRIFLHRQEMTGRKVRDFIDRGLVYAPEDRDNLAVCRALSIMDNALLRAYRDPAVTGRLLFSRSGMREYAQGLITEGQVKAQDVSALAGSLSGGNLQKLIMARELARAPKVFVAAQPTQGLDVSAADRIRTMILSLRSAGVGILLLSSDLDELLQLSDRIMVMFQGRLISAGTRDQLDRSTIGGLMAGGKGEVA